MLLNSQGFFKKYGQILSLFQEEPPESFLKKLDDHILQWKNLSREQIDFIVRERDTARKNKNFSAADKLRQKLTTMGIAVKDSPLGTSWEVKKDEF